MMKLILMILNACYPFRNSPFASNIQKLLLVFPIHFKKMSEQCLDFGHENPTPFIFNFFTYYRDNIPRYTYIKSTVK